MTTDNRGGRSALQRVLTFAYLPYTYLVFIPWLAILTTVVGLSSMAASYFSPRVGCTFGSVWAWLLCRVNLTRVSVKGRENIRPGQSYVIMSNHQSHFDVLAVYGHLQTQFRWVIKQELRKVPVLGPACDRMGHVFIDRSNREKAIASLKEARSRLVDGVSVLFFPEGTRSRDGRMREFKKGGFMMALDLGLPILPISVSGTHKILPGKSLKLLPGHARISIHEPIDVSRYSLATRDELMADVRFAIASGLTKWERGER